MSSYTNIHSTRGKSSWSRLSDDEDWTKLTDINARRRIQNRIAQRNRRKNLKRQREESALQSGSGSDSSPPPQTRSRQSTLTKSPETRSTENRTTPEFVFETPYLRSTASSASTQTTPESSNALNVFPEFSIPGKDSRLQDFLSGKQKAFQPLSPPTTKHDFAACNEDYLYQYLMSGFNGNGMNHFQQNGIPPLTPPLLNDENGQFHTNYMGEYDKMYNTQAPLVSTLGALQTPPNVNDFCFTQSPFSNLNPEQLSILPTDNTTSTTNTDTALHLAAQKGHLEIAEVLLDTGFAINTLNATGSTPLHLCSSSGHLALTSLLLSRGATSSLLNACGQNALHLAASNGHTEVVLLLLDYLSDQDVYAQDFLGQTPFQVAVACGHVEVVRAMLGKGIDMGSGAGKTQGGGEPLGKRLRRMI